MFADIYMGPYFRYFYVNVKVIRNNGSMFWKSFSASEWLSGVYNLLCINDEIPIYYFPFWCMKIFESSKEIVINNTRNEYHFTIKRTSKYTTPPLNTIERVKEFYNNVLEFLEQQPIN